MDLQRRFFALQLMHGFFQQLDVHVEADRADVAVLFAAQDIARAAQFEIQRGDFESGAQVAKFLERGQAFARDFAELRVGRDQQIRVRPAIGPSHAPAQLIQLRQAVALGVLDNHGVGERNIQAVFGDGGAHKHVEIVLHEPEQRLSSSASPICPWPTPSGSPAADPESPARAYKCCPRDCG